MKKLTIITSLYKSSKYLESFLDNITSQSIFKDCELLLWDASPEERNEDIVKKFLDRGSIVHNILIKDPGIYQCWNDMISKSKSKYITNANVDDRLTVDYALEKHVDILDKEQDVDVVYCYNICSMMEPSDDLLITGFEPTFPTAEFSLTNLLSMNLPHNHPVWRRSLHDKFGYFSTDYVSGSDWEFWLRCAVGGTKMKLIHEKLGVYYKNPEGMSTKKENMPRNLKEVENIRTKYMEIVKNEEGHLV